MKEGPLLGQVVLLENYTISTVLCILFLKGLFIIVLAAKMHFLCWICNDSLNTISDT